MKVMLDTNICIHLIRHRSQQLINRFQRMPVGDIGVSSVTVAELEYGVAKSGRRQKNSEALGQFIAPLEVAAFDRTAATTYGKIRAHLERKGQIIGSMDMLIAAHALSLGVRLISNDVAEFKRVPGLKVDNWL